MDNCPICGQPDVAPDSPGMINVNCPKCGNYKISGTAAASIPNYVDNLAKLSIAIRKSTSIGNILEIDTKNAQLLSDSVILFSDPIEAQDYIVLYLAEKSDFIGSFVKIELSDDYPLFGFLNQKELRFVLSNAKNNGIIHNHDSGQYQLTHKGWEIANHLLKKKPSSNIAFVAMWFDTTLTSAWEEGFKPAIIKCGFLPIRIDRVEHNNRIDDEIIATIRKSKFLLADFTGQRSGVFFEAGFGLGMGIPVIWSCRKDQVEELKNHFDTRQYSHIIWSNSEELKTKLINRIQATIL